MKIAPLALLFGCFFMASPVNAGDAVAIGYNAEGVWTMVTYYRSPNPRNGKDYKSEAQAREAAVRDLHRRGAGNLARTEVIASSDATRYVAVARGETKVGTDRTVVGSGKSEAEAEEKALADLNRAGATARQKIIYRYFSHGADSVAKP
jgi:hypothetical protein